MIRALSVADVRSAEANAMAELPEGELMSRAAEGLAEIAAARLAERDGRTVVALIGAGDNGGDALYAAGLLCEAGFACAVVLLPESGRAGVHGPGLEAAELAGATVVVAAADPAAAAQVVAEGDLVLDGIVGIGGRPGLRPAAAALVDAIADDAWVMAVDVASGLDPDGVEVDDDAVWADETVTFGVPKPAHLLPAGESATGRLTVVDIGLAVDDVPAAVERLTYDDVAALWPVPGPGDDKYSRGVLGVVAGGETYTGAAVLAVTAAVECGVGMVRYVGTSTPTGLVRAAVPEAVIGAGQVQAWLIGPGLDPAAAGGGAEAQLTLAREALASDLPAVVDAGGLDLVAARRTGPTLLTPHAGELARLLTRLAVAREPAAGPVTREQVEREPVRHARLAAELTGATVLLKGSTTLVVGPEAGAPVRTQADAPAWLATAGSGDVLAGVAGSLLAAGLDALDAGSLAALVHGVAADRASGGGPLRARVVAEALRPTIRDLLRRA
ncbi:bifunctional ADP-dependent NAD(P)H-hydrate dehydratase/NAD(P)H-hydrate epimerase [Intrasporangium sp.]|uniref:bifunctional ADP-dependent NAD(P)H-hydrate dehydratase/NAD(P)H-hydrate epimerase n=1 Tax=Intrasporangium sp. TaxID=1925024 RepID=UPI00293B4462|nr:NAD(P)H-hydrate dehydratase [Intrasporangium sp.]MDV3220325.1 bifunctional ADP-dependent NAD(P)H-hydrate dehydratase/NAD(P)H-hydrate epimerase [Intrasporangium sp.]